MLNDQELRRIEKFDRKLILLLEQLIDKLSLSISDYNERLTSEKNPLAVTQSTQLTEIETLLKLSHERRQLISKNSSRR